MTSFKIRDDETLIEALRRELGREPDYEDVIRFWGGRMVGESQDTGRRNPQSRSVDDGIL